MTPPPRKVSETNKDITNELVCTFTLPFLNTTNAILFPIYIEQTKMDISSFFGKKLFTQREILYRLKRKLLFQFLEPIPRCDSPELRITKKIQRTHLAKHDRAFQATQNHKTQNTSTIFIIQIAD